MDLNNLEMTNKEAANILKLILNTRICVLARGNGKSLMNLRIIQAFAKAIDILEKTPDNSRKNHTPL